MRRSVSIFAIVSSLAGVFTIAGNTPAFASGATISTLAGDGSRGFLGDGGAATAAEFSDPYGLAVDTAGNVFVADASNNRIRRIDHATGIITTVVGTGAAGQSGDGGPATAAQISGQSNQQLGVSVDAAGNLYIAEADNADVRKVDHTTGIITTVVGNGTRGYSGDGGPATAASVDNVNKVIVSGGNLYVADYVNRNVRKVSPSGIITTFAGDGTGSTSGDGGPATAAGIPAPVGLAADPAGNIYIGQESFSNAYVRKVDTSGIITTVAGVGVGISDDGDGGPATAARIADPTDLAVDSAGRLLISTVFAGSVRRVDTNGTIHTIAGSGTRGYDGDGANACLAHTNFPNGIGLDGAGNLYFTDASNMVVRKVTAPMPNCIQPVRGLITDFDTDFSADVSVYRKTSGTWFDKPSSGGSVTSVNYGASGDVPVPGDYDGDYTTDQAIYRPSTGLWAIHNSSGGDTFVTFGGVPGDIPVPGDYDGDGKTDLAVYRPSSGIWFVQGSNGNNFAVRYGERSGDIPVPADYDGDGKIDFGIFESTTGTWYARLSNSPFNDMAIAYGASGDIPLPVDFDGDGKADIAIFRPTTGLWAVHPSSGSPDTFSTYGGISGDVPVPGDYDGDHQADMAIFRPSIGGWYVHQTITNTDAVSTFGIQTDTVLQLPPAVRLTFFP